MSRIYKPRGYQFITDEETGMRLAISSLTGEVTATAHYEVPIGTQFITPDHRERKKKIAEAFSYNKLLRKCKEPLGNYIFVSAHSFIADISPESFARLILLATYLHHNSDILYKTQRSKLKKPDLIKALGISQPTFSRFWTEVKDKYLWTDNEDNVHISADYFYRGDFSCLKNHRDYQQVFIQYYRRLYEAAPVTSHRYIGYIFKMLPYVSIKFNTLCDNPFEKEEQKLELLSVENFCEKINYSKTQYKRLINTYNNLKFDAGGVMEPLCSFRDINESGKLSVIINPCVIHRGTDWNSAARLGAFSFAGFFKFE